GERCGRPARCPDLPQARAVGACSFTRTALIGKGAKEVPCQFGRGTAYRNWPCQFGRATSRAQHLESPSEVQEETHVSRTACRIKLVFGETGLQDKMATDCPVDSQIGFQD